MFNCFPPQKINPKKHQSSSHLHFSATVPVGRNPVQRGGDFPPKGAGIQSLRAQTARYQRSIMSVCMHTFYCKNEKACVKMTIQYGIYLHIRIFYINLC